MNTTPQIDLLNVTSDVKRAFRESAVQKGLLTVYLPLSAGSVVVLENDPAILSEFKSLIASFVPDAKGPRPSRRSGTGSAAGHLRAGLLPPSVGIPIQNGRLLLGAWQEVFVLDADDKASRREVVIQVMGMGNKKEKGGGPPDDDDY